VTPGADVVVIGGGIAGCASAWFLARRGARVVVVEKGETPAWEQSGRALGHVRQQGRHQLEIPLAKESSRIWGDLAAELQAETQFVRGGVLTLAETEADEANLAIDARLAKEHGFGARLISGREVAAIIPEMAGTWRAGLWSPDDGNASPPKATRALAEAAERRGAEIRCGVTVTGLDVSGGAITAVRTSAGTIRTPQVVCAAGIWSTKVASWVGLKLPLQVIRTSLAETAPATVTTRVAVYTPYVSFRPSLEGTWWIGGGYRGAGVDYDLTLSTLRHLRFFMARYRQNWRHIKLGLGSEFLADLGRLFKTGEGAFRSGEPGYSEAILNHNIRRFRELMPQQAAVEIARRWAGRIDLTPDLVPALGPTARVRGLHFATGLSGHGIVLGPVVGRTISELILDGRSALDVSVFSPDRFAEGRLAPPSLSPEFFYSKTTTNHAPSAGRA